MKTIALFSLATILLFLASCGPAKVPATDLSEPEKNLLNALNGHRAKLGKGALVPSEKMMEIARGDASRRASEGGGYQDHREQTDYERMLTLAGKAKEGPDFGSTLMEFWQKNPTQKEWLDGSYSDVGVGAAAGKGGLQTGILLLGGS